MAPSRSVVLAGVTTPPRINPRVSTSKMPLAAFDAFAGIVTHRAAMTGGLDALAVQDRRGRLATFSLSFPNQDAQSIIEGRPQIAALPASEDTIDRLPGRKAGGQIPSGDAAFDPIEDHVNYLAHVGGGTAAWGGFGQHGFEIFPLGIGETGRIWRFSSPQRKLPFKNGRTKPTPMSTTYSIFLRFFCELTR